MEGCFVILEVNKVDGMLIQEKYRSSVHNKLLSDNNFTNNKFKFQFDFDYRQPNFGPLGQLTGNKTAAAWIIQ